ncbi:MAG: zinc ribbon domain-containing protein [Rhizobiaceae bacterium]
MTKYCQSCGMPMNKDAKGGGTNSDGSKSTEYCSLCFEDGNFVHTDFTVEQMQTHCVNALKGHGMPGFMAWIFTRGLPKLERWKKA